MRIYLNGETCDIEPDSSLASLVLQLNLRPEQIAIELNQKVVRRAQWETVQVCEDDKIEVVHFVGGGGGALI